MKKILLSVFSLLLFSCVGLPEPKTDSDALVIGSFILDFPDGFFNRPPATIEDDVKLNFINLTTNIKFRIKTKNGYFFFLADGNSEYLLESYQYGQTIENRGDFSLGKTKINMKFTTVSNEVVYLGDLGVIYKLPEVTKKKPGTTKVYYSFRRTFFQQNKEAKLLQYMSKKYAGSVWLTRKVDNSFAGKN